MKILLLAGLVLGALVAQAQEKAGFTGYNKLVDLKGTDYALATMENQSKLGTSNAFLLFINTVTGESKPTEFPKDTQINRIEHIRIDSLKLNKVLVSAKSIDQDGSKSINWNDPTQLFLFPVNGSEKVQLTPDAFFVQSWLVKKGTATLLITGYYDTNGNQKFDKPDKSELMIYDLRTMKVLKKL